MVAELWILFEYVSPFTILSMLIIIGKLSLNIINKLIREPTNTTGIVVNKSLKIRGTFF